MKKWHVILLTVLMGSVLVAVVLLHALSAAFAYSGPGVYGNLIALEVAKARWAEAHTNSDWPTMQDISPYFTNGTTCWMGGIRTVRKEIYIINKVGTPVIAYDPMTQRISHISSNDYSQILQEDKECKGVTPGH